MLFTETMLTEYSQPLSEAEDRRCKNAINMIRDALKNIGYFSSASGPTTYACNYIDSCH